MSILQKIFNFAKKEGVSTPSYLRGEDAFLRSSFFFSNSQFEEWNPDELASLKGYDVYRKMLRDSQVKSAYNILINLIVQRDWCFELEEEDEQQVEIKEFFEYTLKNLKNTFTQSMRNILLAKAHGFSVSEKVFKPVDFNGSPKWTVSEIKQKPYESFFFKVDDYGNIVEIEQDNGSGRIVLPIEKFIHYVNYPELDPIWGESELRSIYRPYWEKQNILTFWNIYLERSAGGFLTATPKNENISLSPGEKNAFDNLLKNINQATAMRVPAGYEIDLHNPTNSTAFQDAVEHRDKQIAKGLFVPNQIGLSEQSGGSYALSKTQLDVFMMTINFNGDQLADTLNEQLFSQLAKLNYNVDTCPRFKFENRTEEQKQQVAQIWFEAVKNGVVTNTEEDEQRTRELLGYPPKVEDEQEEVEEVTEEEVAKVEEDKEEMSLKFAEQKENQHIDRISFDDIEQLMDSNEAVFFNELVKNIDAIAKSITKSISKTLNDVSEKKPNFKKAIDSLDTAINDNQLKNLNQTIRGNLLVQYDDARQIAQDTLKSANRTLPKKERSKLNFAISTNKRLCCLDEKWTVLHFVDKVRLDTAEKFFKEKAFYITGVLSEDMVKAAKQVLLTAIQNNWSTEQAIDELERVLSPFTGKITIEPETGEIIPTTEEEKATQGRLRLETVVRTNMIDAFNQAWMNTYTDSALDGFVVGLEYSAIIDKRTTDFCRKYNGFKRKLNDPIWSQIRPPNHFNCRSTVIPITLVDPDFKETELPKKKKAIEQPQAGFGLVTDRNEV